MTVRVNSSLVASAVAETIGSDVVAYLVKHEWADVDGVKVLNEVKNGPFDVSIENDRGTLIIKVSPPIDTSEGWALVRICERKSGKMCAWFSIEGTNQRFEEPR